MQEDIRSYTTGFRLVGIRNNSIILIPYTIVDDDRLEGQEISMMIGDSFQFEYQKSVKFEDTITIGDRTGVLSRSAKR